MSLIRRRQGTVPEQRNATKLSLSLRALRGAVAETFDEKTFSDLIEAIADFSSEQGVSADTEELQGGVFGDSSEYENALRVFEDQEVHARNHAAKRLEEKQTEIRPEADLVRGLQKARTVVARGHRAGLTLLRAPSNYDFAKLAGNLVERADRRKKASKASAADVTVKRRAVVQVPKPSKTAYNPDRPMSLLLKAQVEHLREAESKLPLRYRHEIDTYIKAIKTEGEAAAYIRKVTEAIHDAHADAERARHAPKRKRVMEIAAVADERAQRTNRLRRKKRRKRNTR